MPARKVPAAPLVAIIGSTGTGKSDLAVELACRFNGEVINADAMQLYKGLPIITNKITVAEQRGIPHHLLGKIELDQESWTVGVFKREASRIIKEIRSRGRLPIVVGGTHYYINGLLFEDNLVDGPNKAAPTDALETDSLQGQRREENAAAEFPILDGPTDAILSKLREVDPIMADRWHPNDRRKIQRSLEIYLTTGRRASDIYSEQQKRKEVNKERRENQRQQPLMLWVHCEQEALHERLNSRVDKMVHAGLLDETREMFDYLRPRRSTIDRSKGIWQSIGFKEFEPYLQTITTAQQGNDDGNTSLEQADRLLELGTEDTKTATRRYAKSQLRWINLKTIPLVREEGLMSRLFVLDSSDRSRWQGEVADCGADLAARFLAGEELPDPASTSAAAAAVLAEADDVITRNRSTPCRRHCHACQTTLLTEEDWEKHLRGNRHRRMLRHARRTALVSVEPVEPSRAVGDGENEEVPSENIEKESP